MTEPNPRRPRRQFTAEFRADAVRLATTSQTSIAQTARDLGIGDTLLRVWIAAARAPEKTLTPDERKEALTRSSGLEWVIARPGRLMNGPARGRFVAQSEIAPVPGSIARADVAEFLVTTAETDTWVGKAVQLGG
jgi:transposase